MLPSSRAYADSRPQAPFFDPPEPQYQCSAADCDATAWTPEEHHQCIACKRRFCCDCLIAIGPEKYCPACAKCVCGGLAIDACNECGEVKCAKCLGDSSFCKFCKIGDDAEAGMATDTVPRLAAAAEVMR